LLNKKVADVNNEALSVTIGLAKQRKNGKQRRKPDLRIGRTRSLLSNALVALMAGEVDR